MRTLVIGDLHCPAVHPAYLGFCKEIQRKYKTNNTVFIGDIIDHEAISMHDKNPDLPGPLEEYKAALVKVKEWYKAFPNATVCVGNHDARVHRKSNKHGIPSMYLKSFSDLYNTPKWNWVLESEVDEVLYTHGDGWGGMYPSFNAAKARLQSVVCGHHHSIASINWIRGPKTMYFGMNVGAGIDQSNPVFQYSKAHLKKAIISCGVIIDGKQPYLEIY